MEKSKRTTIIVVGILLVGLFIGVAYKEGVRKGMKRAAAPMAPAVTPVAAPVIMPAAPAAGVASIGSITQASVGQRATLKGNIVSVYVFKGEKGRSVKISDGTGTIDILIWNNLFYQIPQKDSLNPGTSVQVSGEIASYKGRLQIKPRSPSDIQIAGAAPAVAPTIAPVAPVAGVTPISSITQASVGQRATLKGTITSVRVFRSGKGRTINISDGTGTMDILIWNNLFYQIPQKDSLNPGTSLQVSGEIASYKGKLQIKPRSPSDVQIAGAAPAVAPAVPAAPAAPMAVPVPVTTGKININTASQSELESLPGIGPAYAQRIISGRPYARVDDLVKVKGIGPATLEKLRPRVTVK